MKFIHGSDGGLKYNNVTVATAMDWVLNIVRDKTETTPANTYDKEYFQQHRGITGTATILYDPSNAIVAQLFSRILDNDPSPNRFNFVLYGATGHSYVADCFIDSITTPRAAKDLMAVQIGFTVQGRMALVN